MLCLRLGGVFASGLVAVGDVNRELARAPGIRLERRPPWSVESTWADIEAARFESDYSFRRDEKGWHAGVLRLWTQPYGHTTTSKIVATAAGSGVQQQFTPASLAGDVDALPVASIQTGSQLAHGRLVGLSLLPHPSYAPLATAGVIAAVSDSGGLVGDHSSVGSQAYVATMTSDLRGGFTSASRSPSPASTTAPTDSCSCSARAYTRASS